MTLQRFRLLISMEWMKTCCRLNIGFSSIVFILVLIQVAFLVPMDAGGAEDSFSAEDIQSHATRYINNLAFTFIPVLLLVNIGREFEYAIVQRSLFSGISRPGFFNGKLIQLGLFSLFAFLLATIFTILSAAIHQVPVVWDLKRLLMYFVVAFSLGSLALMIVFILKKRLQALAVFVAYTILENTLVALAPGKTILLPFLTCVRLLKQGIYQLPELIMVAVYTFIFLAIAYQVFRSSDLK